MRKINKDAESKIIKIYENGLGTIEISKKFNLHRSTVQRILKRNKIKLRKARLPSHHYNTSFFSKYNSLSCYWAGFIAADGYIRNNKRNTLHIKLATIDKNI